MNSPSSPPSGRIVAVGSTISEAFAFCWRNRADLLTLAAPGIVILSLVNAVLAAVMPGPGPAAVEEGAAPAAAQVLPPEALATIFIFAIPALYFWSTFAVAWHRRYLVAGESPMVRDTLRWLPRHTRYLLMSLALFALLGLIAGLTARAAFVGLLLAAILYGRFAFILPAASVDERASFIDSWRLTHGNTLRIVGVLVPVAVILLIVAVLFWALIMPQVASRPTLLPVLLGSLVNQTVTFLSTAVFVTALSLIYRQLRPQAVTTVH